MSIIRATPISGGSHHRAAAADKDAAAALRQRIVGRTLRHADVDGGRKLEPAADDRAMQHGDHRHLAELDAVERAMPGARMRDAAEDVALLEFGEVKPGAEMFTIAGKHDRADVIRQRIKKRHHALHEGIV
jgi:hypothetical protein